MADPNPTIGDLFRAKAVTDKQVNAAVEVFMKDARTGTHSIADGYSLDLAAAVARHGCPSQVVVDTGSSPSLKRASTRTAILLAGEQKA